MRTKKGFLNTLSDFLYELVAVVCGMILPHMILGRFGSAYNGITSSISQFISCITLLKSGIGGVTRASLYRPLAEKDYHKISGIVRATEIFMRRIALVFLLFLLVFACGYPFFVAEEFNWFFSFSLVLIIGVTTVVQYYFGITYQILLRADQRIYIYTFIHIGTTILNTLIAVLLIKLGCGIHLVKLGSSLVFMITPFLLYYYLPKYYHLSKDVEPDMSAISQRWDAFALEFANFINNNTDVVVLTIFTDMKTVSVYTVYHLVLNSFQKLIPKIASGLEAGFGDIMARNEYQKLAVSFSSLEYLVVVISTIVYTCVILLIVPFVKLYTADVSDVNYLVYDFAIVASLASYFYCVRSPYQYIVQAAGHFSQTKIYSFIEAAINIVVSVILSLRIGLCGVAIGTLLAMVFRTFQYAWYTYKNIIKVPFGSCVLKYLVSFVCMLMSIFIFKNLPVMAIVTVGDWLVSGIIIFVIVSILLMISTVLFFRADFRYFKNAILSLLHKRGRVR